VPLFDRPDHCDRLDRAPLHPKTIDENMKSFVIASALCALGLCARASAEEERVIGVVAGPPTKVGVLDAQTGRLKSGPILAAAAGAPVVCYANTSPDATTGLYEIVAVSNNKEYLDFGQWSGASCGSNTVTNFSFAYATLQTTPVDLTVRLYDGSNPTTPSGPFCIKGTLLAELAFTGLQPSVSGGYELYAYDVDLSAAPLTVTTGTIGYSYQFFNAVTNATVAVTVGGTHPPGDTDSFNRYTVSTGVCDGTFFYGGEPGPYGSYWGEWTVEVNNPCGTSVYGENLGGINLGVLAVSGTAAQGQTLTFTMTNPQNPPIGGNTKGYLYLSLAEFDLFLPDLDPPDGGTLLIDPSLIFFVYPPKTFPILNPSATQTLAIPVDPILVGVEGDAQALYISTNVNTPLRLTNGAKFIICP
jgi:hypothetical protein